MPLSRFTSGPPEGVRKLNAIVDVVNDLNNMRGDDRFVTLRKGPSGALVSLNVQEIIRLVPKVGQPGPMPDRFIISAYPLVLPAGQGPGALWFPAPARIRGVVGLTDQNDMFTVDIQKAQYSAYPTASSIVAGAPVYFSGSKKYKDTTLTDWTLDILADDILIFIINGTPAVATWVSINLELDS